MDTFWNRKRKRRKKKKKHNESIVKDRIIRNIRTLFEQEEEHYYEPKRVSNFWNSSYIEYEGNGDKNINLSLDEYLNKIKLYLRNVIVDLQNSGVWKIQLTIAIHFVSSKVGEEEPVMHSSSGNIKFTPYSDANYVIDELFESVCSKYQVNLETSMTGSHFIFDSVQSIYYKCHRVNFILDGSYIDCSDWIKKKKATINAKNTDD